MAEGTEVVADDRRTAVLRAALLTFARFGYRKTSMDQVSRDADISRPGLYFLFASKQALFREAVECCLRDDLAAVARAVTDNAAPLHLRLLHAFDHWAGRYVGPLTRDITTVVEDNPELLGPVALAAPARFAELVLAALAEHLDLALAEQVAQTLISTSIGVKHQVDDREGYLRRMQVALDLVIPVDGRHAACGSMPAMRPFRPSTS